MMSRMQSRALSLARSDDAKSRALRRIVGVATFAVATAVGAKVAIPLPGTPVPFTFQVVFVILAGALLGPRLGATSQIAYVALGVTGAPVFAAGGGLAYLLGPTGGYLLAFPLAAFTVGLISGKATGIARLTLALVAGVAVIHAGGASWLAVTTGNLEQALRFGVGPFLAYDVVKIGLALAVSLKLRPRALDRF